MLSKISTLKELVPKKLDSLEVVVALLLLVVTLHYLSSPCCSLLPSTTHCCLVNVVTLLLLLSPLYCNHWPTTHPTMYQHYFCCCLVDVHYCLVAHLISLLLKHCLYFLLTLNVQTSTRCTMEVTTTLTFTFEKVKLICFLVRFLVFGLFVVWFVV